MNGPYPKGYRLIKWLSDLVFTASMTDATINARLTEVTTMLAHANKLMRPSTILRALYVRLRHR